MDLIWWPINIVGRFNLHVSDWHVVMQLVLDRSSNKWHLWRVCMSCDWAMVVKKLFQKCWNAEQPISLSPFQHCTELWVFCEQEHQLFPHEPYSVQHGFALQWIMAFPSVRPSVCPSIHPFSNPLHPFWGQSQGYWSMSQPLFGKGVVHPGQVTSLSQGHTPSHT